jgi:hypothetical protein
MYKQIGLMKRKPGMTMEEFIDRYENGHVKIGENVFLRAKRYMRRYVTPLKNPLTGETKELDFDVIMELWWDTTEDMAADMKDFAASDLVPLIKESGANLFASADNPAFTVMEYETPRG